MMPASVCERSSYVGEQQPVPWGCLRTCNDSSKQLFAFPGIHEEYVAIYVVQRRGEGWTTYAPRPQRCVA
eukprot:5653238-Lingulodinium_polyedra.AAC.1